MPPLWSPERPPRPYNTSQRKNGPNYHFHLCLFSTDEPPDPHYENPPHMFQSSQQTFTMEIQYLPHDLFDQILSRRLWKNLN